MTAPVSGFDAVAVFAAVAPSQAVFERLELALSGIGRLIAVAEDDGDTLPAAEPDALVFDVDGSAADPARILGFARQRAPLAQVVFLGAASALTQVRQRMLLLGGLRDQWTFLKAEEPDAWPALLAEAQARTARRRMLGAAGLRSVLPAARPVARKPAVPSLPFLDRMLEHVSDVVLFLDLQGRITYHNTAAEALSGRDAGTLAGATMEALVAPPCLALHQASMASVRQEATGCTVALDYARPDGRTVPVEQAIAPVKDWRGQTFGYSIIARDLTARRETERAERLAAENRLALVHAEALKASNEELASQAEELAAQTEELTQLNETLHMHNERVEREVAARTEALRTALTELALANERLRLADRHKDEFLSVISHELRTPLNFIMGFASIVADEVQGSLNPGQLQAMGKILNGTDLMLALVDDLLDFARMQAGNFKVELVSTDFEALIGQVVANLDVLAQRKELRLELVVDVQGRVLVDDHRVAQVVTNLVSNAIKFTDAGCVRISATRRGDELRTEVTDTGIGISPADAERLFERFQQLDMSKTRKAGGTGLGLAISKAIVEAHGGRIGLESVPGQGSTFWFTLPVPAASP